MKFGSAVMGIFCCIIGCQERTSEKQLPGKPATEVTAAEPPALDSFTEFPEEADGCSCYFAKNKEDFAAGKYIYVNDYANLSFVSLNGKMVELQLKSESDSLSKEKIFMYSNPDYDLKVELNSREQNGYETSWIEGNLVLTSRKTKKQKSFRFVGECGC